FLFLTAHQLVQVAWCDQQRVRETALYAGHKKISFTNTWFIKVRGRERTLLWQLPCQLRDAPVLPKSQSLNKLKLNGMELNHPLRFQIPVFEFDLAVRNRTRW
ncbi:MAG: hypothetical protein WBF42_00520, partial [Terracidiphilus sp.]